MSKQVEALTGYCPEDFTSRGLSRAQLIHPDDREAVAREVDEGVAGGGRFSVEYRIIRNDGELRWVKEEGVVVDRGPDGAILEGFTVRAGTQEMMPFAEVFWMNAASGVVRTSSDSGGAWRITGIPAGEIRLFGRKRERNSEGQPAVRTGERVFPVEEGARLQNVLIHLQ